MVNFIYSRNKKSRTETRVIDLVRDKDSKRKVIVCHVITYHRQ